MEFLHLNEHSFSEIKATTTVNGRRYDVGDDVWYPSVTTVIGEMKKKSIMAWRKRVGEEEANKISKRASTRGNKTHKLAEEYLLNKDLNKYKDDPLSLGMFYQIKPYIDKINNIHALEAPLYSHTLKLAGRVDCIAEYEGELAIIDFKTSEKIKPEKWMENYFVQEMFYAAAYFELTGIPVTKLITIMVTPGGEVEVFDKRNKGDYIKLLVRYIKEFVSHNTGAEHGE